MKKFLKIFALMLLAGALVFGLVSCANASGSDSDLPKNTEVLDRFNQQYRDGFYKYNDGNTTMYLYFEYKNLVSAGNLQDKFPSSQIEILKQSHTWSNVHQYCEKYDVSINTNAYTYNGKWMLGVYPAEKLFKKGWYRINISNNGEYFAGYFENYNSSMSYTFDWHYGDGNNVYRTNNFVNNDYYSNKSWDSLLKDYANTDYSSVYFTFLSENFNAYQERPSEN